MKKTKRSHILVSIFAAKSSRSMVCEMLLIMIELDHSTFSHSASMPCAKPRRWVLHSWFVREALDHRSHGKRFALDERLSRRALHDHRYAHIGAEVPSRRDALPTACTISTSALFRIRKSARSRLLGTSTPSVRQRASVSWAAWCCGELTVIHLRTAAGGACDVKTVKCACAPAWLACRCR